MPDELIPLAPAVSQPRTVRTHWQCQARVSAIELCLSGEPRAVTSLRIAYEAFVPLMVECVVQVYQARGHRLNSGVRSVEGSEHGGKVGPTHRDRAERWPR